MKNARGFTLIEMAITIALIGVVSIIVAPVLGEMTSRQVIAYRSYQLAMNRRITDIFSTYAATSSTTGVLPTPFSNGSDTFSAPTDLSLGGPLNALLQMGNVPGNEVNDDNRAAHTARVYQSLPALYQTVPFDVQSGPQVNLRYQFGVVYSTACPKADTNCNKGPVPGASPVLTTANFGYWEPTAPDFGAAFISSLPVQMDMLAKTRSRAYQVRDAFTGYFRQMQTASPGATTNFFPNSGATIVGSASSNQGCWYQWINLAATSVLNTVGLPPAEYGVTAWGGSIEYCRDYDGTGAGAADAAPHYGALRFHKDISAGIAPNTSTASNNVVLTF